MKNIEKNIGLVIRRHRARLDLSQEEFAEKVDVHRTYISDIEFGKVSISLKVAQKVALALRIPLSKLIKEAEAQ